MSYTTLLATGCLIFGTVATVRGAFIIATGGRGRFFADPWVSLLGGFALIILGRFLINRPG